MDTSTDIADTFLKRPPAEYFQISAAQLSSVEWDLASRPFTGLALGCPANINTGERETLPLLVATQFGAKRDWRTPISENLFVLLFDQTTSTVSAATPFAENNADRPDPGEPERGPEPVGDAAGGVATSVRLVDARELFRIDWKRPRSLSLFALSFDFISNPATVTLSGDTPVPAAVAKPVNPTAGEAEGSLPSYDPAFVKMKPGGNALAFTLAIESGVCLARGVIKIPVRAHHLPAGPTTVAGRRVAAVIPVSLVLTGRAWQRPWIFDWAVPAFGDDAAVGTPVLAVFAIPLPDEKFLLLAGGDYVGWMILDGTAYGPARFTK